jgi:hypothetical protein
MKALLASMVGMLVGCGVQEYVAGGQDVAIPGEGPEVTLPGLPLETPTARLARLRGAPHTPPIVARPLTPSVPQLAPPVVDAPLAQAPGCVASGEPSALVQTAPFAGVPMPAATTYRYRLGETGTLYLGALVRNVCGRQIAAFDLFAPDGSFYDRLPAVFTVGGEGARPVGDGWVVEVALPLSEASLAGVWSVNFRLGENDLALGFGLFELYR